MRFYGLRGGAAKTFFSYAALPLNSVYAVLCGSMGCVGGLPKPSLATQPCPERVSKPCANKANGQAIGIALYSINPATNLSSVSFALRPLPQTSVEAAGAQSELQRGHPGYNQPGKAVEQT